MIVFQTLKRIAYPIFRPKIKSISGSEQLPRSGGYVLAANHVDWLDGFYIAAAVGSARNTPVHFLTKSNNYWWTQVAIQIPTKPADIVDTAVQNLRRGRIICNFPEGARNEMSHLLPGKTGTVRMAALAGVPVVPLGIQCKSNRTMQRSILHLMSKGPDVVIRFGEPMQFPIPTGGMTKEWLEESTSHLMSAIARLAGKRI